MTCLEFEEMLNRLVDGGIWPSDGGAELPEEFSGHRASCERCERTARAFDLLARAIAATPPSRPSAELAARIERAAARRVKRVWLGRLVVAASFLLAVGLSGYWRGRGPILERRDQAPVVPAPARSGDSLGEAIAEAALATWDLARETSDPAARLGSPLFARPVILEPGPSSVIPSVSGTLSVGGFPPSLSLLSPDAAGTTGVLEQVGDRLIDGVRPLSNSARNVLERWLGPPRDRPSRPGSPAKTKGV